MRAALVAAADYHGKVALAEVADYSGGAALVAAASALPTDWSMS